MLDHELSRELLGFLLLEILSGLRQLVGAIILFVFLSFFLLLVFSNTCAFIQSVDAS